MFKYYNMAFKHNEQALVLTSVRMGKILSVSVGRVDVTVGGMVTDNLKFFEHDFIPALCRVIKISGGIKTIQFRGSIGQQLFQALELKLYTAFELCLVGKGWLNTGVTTYQFEKDKYRADYGTPDEVYAEKLECLYE